MKTTNIVQYRDGVNLASRIYKVLAKNIRTFRKLRGISQSELADAVGLTVSMVSKIEQATAAPSLENLEKIAKALNVPIDRLLA
jgi:transcriptional regulator with XRE-family HTH domain